MHLHIMDMDCASCVRPIESDLKKLSGVKIVNINFATSQAEVKYDPEQTDSNDIIKTIKKSGYQAMLIGEEGKQNMLPGQMNHTKHQLDANMNNSTDQADHAAHAEMESERALRSRLNKFIFALLLSILVIALAVFPQVPNAHVIMLIATLLILIYSGQEFFRRGIPSLLRLSPGMDTLVAIGVATAFLYSSYVVLFTDGKQEYFLDAAIITTFIILGRYLEAQAKGKAGAAIKKLFELSAKLAHRLTKQNNTEDIPVAEIRPGDLLLVKPGEKIPTDGVITQGTATINEAMVTGESLPVAKQTGSAVIGATINGNTVFTMRAEKVGAETMLAHIIQLVRMAQMSKAPIQKLVDLISNYFVWTVILIAIGTFTSWFYLTADFAQAIIYTVAVLIIACPCALGLATPISIVVGSGRGASAGILLKKPESLEKAHKITAICFDKTGTITEGKPKVVIVSDPATLAIAYSLEKVATHPLADAVVEYAEKNKLKAKKVTGFKNIVGRGIIASIGNNHYILGNNALLKENNVLIDNKLQQKIADDEAAGRTFLFLAQKMAKNAKYLGYIALEDKIKASSAAAITLLKQHGIKPIMLTGDNTATATAVAKQVGIKEFAGRVQPGDKLKKIQELQEQGEFVAMVGDGINDSPALAQANIGIAMGTGTDIAMESGDIVIVKGDLAKVAEAIGLSRATMRNIKQNLFWAFIYNTIGIPIAALGFLSPIFSAAAMAFSSISVVLNALRLRRYKI